MAWKHVAYQSAQRERCYLVHYNLARIFPSTEEREAQAQATVEPLKYRIHILSEIQWRQYCVDTTAFVGYHLCYNLCVNGLLSSISKQKEF